MEYERRTIAIKRIVAVLLALGLAAWFQEIFSIEWSSANCANATDGPVSAVWGMPLPYIRWSTVFSMEYFWMPTIFALNLLLLFAVLFPFIGWMVRRMRSRVLLSISCIAGVFLVFTFAASIGLQLYTGVYKIAVANIANESYETYSDFRPVGFGFKSLRYQCTPLK